MARIGYEIGSWENIGKEKKEGDKDGRKKGRSKGHSHLNLSLIAGSIALVLDCGRGPAPFNGVLW